MILIEFQKYHELYVVIGFSVKEIKGKIDNSFRKKYTESILLPHLFFWYDLF